MISDTLSCRLALSDEELCAAYNIRHKVFVEEQGFDPNLDIDSLDEIAAHLLLIDTSNGSVKGTLRIIPCPLPSGEVTFPGCQRKDQSPPGRARTEEQVIASIANQQEVVEETANGPSILLSGVKFGRIVVSSSLRGQGAGRFLVDSAEKWVVEALAQVPVKQGVKEVEALIQLGGQVRARQFYDRLNYATDNVEFLDEGEPHVLFKKRVTVRKGV